MGICASANLESPVIRTHTVNSKTIHNGLEERYMQSCLERTLLGKARVTLKPGGSLIQEKPLNKDGEERKWATIRNSVNAVQALKSTESQANVKALHGDVTMECPSDANIVRIFTSSTFTDTKHERNYLMQHAYPKIKSHCQSLGYEFQVVDMRWGVRDEAADDHMTTELCLKELKLCQEVSTGPNFVTLLSHKYGYTPFPRVILASEFETLMTGIQDENTLALFKKWYTRDDNAIPPEYVLSPISKHIPAFIGAPGPDKELAKQTWTQESESMKVALEQSATQLFDEQYARKFVMSVTESEIKEGLLDLEEPSDQCLWLKRDIDDIDKQDKNNALSRFMECLGPEAKANKAQTLLNDLKENKMKTKLHENMILQYNVHWADNGGINPEESEEHRTYLKTMSDDFTRTMIGMIGSAVSEKSGKDDRLVNECLQHIRFCQRRCRIFHGRNETLEKIRAYVTAGDAKKAPLVIHGTSGSGKTSIMAMVAKLAAGWKKPKPLILLRFLGTTQDSSSLMSLLYSMTSQLERCLKQNISPPTEVQIARFWEAVHKYKALNPLVIILDSLDQLDDAYDARRLQWMACKAAQGTIILSTLEEPQYECYAALQQIIKRPSNFVGIPSLSRQSTTQILSSWFNMNRRQITDKQMNLLLNAFDQCSTPLFLKLSFDEAIRWTSYISEDEIVLRDTVRASIDHLFERLERLHGKMLLSRSLSYLTLARNGASEVELEDILSCDDDVLNDVYVYATPPTRRLPPLLLVRIRTDLSQYLDEYDLQVGKQEEMVVDIDVERGSDGVKVLYWYHRQFIEAAEARYCSEPETVQVIHRNLADFFGGVWANGNKKPGMNSKSEPIAEDRYVSAQPLLFGEGKPNLRRLNNLPYHCIKGGNVDTLMKQCMANIEFLRIKLNAVNFMSVLDDFKMASNEFPDVKLISAILDGMQLSQKGLMADSGQIVPQMLQRLTETAETSDFLRQCRDHQHIFLEPNIPLLDLPGGRLVNTLPAHTGRVNMIDISTDGNKVLTVCRTQGEIFVWSVQEGKKLREIQSPGLSDEAYFCMDDTSIVLGTAQNKIARVIDVETGIMKLQIQMLPDGCCVAGTKKDILVVFGNDRCNIHNLNKNGDLLGTAKLPETGCAFGKKKAGSSNFVAVTVNDRNFISVLDLQTKKFLKQFPAIPSVENKDTDKGVDSICITPDETCLVYTIHLSSTVIITDFTGTQLRCIPAIKFRNYTNLELSQDGVQMFVCDGHKVHIINYQSLQEVDVIDTSRLVTSIKKGTADCVVTMTNDSNLRIWNMSRQKLQVSYKSTSLKQTTMKTSFFLRNPRYLLTAGSVLGKNNLTLVVYDIFKDKAVRTFKIITKSKTLIYLINDTQTLYKAHLVIDRKLFTIDLNTMTIEMSIDGYLDKNHWYRHKGIQCTSNNEIVCLTKGSKNLKLYDQTTGKVTKVIKGGEQERIEAIKVSKSGRIAFALTKEGVIMMFDTLKYKHIYSFIYTDVYKWSFMMINRQDTVLIFSVRSALAEFGKKGDVSHMVVWDIKNKKQIGRMVDIEYEEMYRLTGKIGYVGLTERVEPLYELDEERVLSIGNDSIMRIHDFNTGKLLHRMEGHFSEPVVYIEENCPYFLTHHWETKEGCLRLWNKQTYQCLASFTFEKKIRKFSISPDGRFFTCVLFQNPKKFLVQWRIHHSPFDCAVDESTYPEIFPSEVEGENFVYDEKMAEVKHDPDDEDDD